MQPRIENHWTWQVDANSLGLSLGFMQGRIFSLFLEADSPSSLKLQVLSFEFKYFCCWWMEQQEVTIHFQLLSGWICTLLSQHPALDYTMSFLPFSRKGEETSLPRVAVESPWQPINVGYETCLRRGSSL